MSTKILGVDVLVKADGVVLGSQKDASLSVSAKEIDVSDKTTGGWDTFLVGNRSWEISCDCIALYDDVAQDSIVSDALNGQTVTVIFSHGDNLVYVGDAVISSVELTGPKDDVSTASFTLKGATALDLERSPEYASHTLDTADKVVTITFTESIANNLADVPALKAAVTFAADGTTFGALAAADTVSIAAGKLVVTFDSALTTATNKIKVAAGALKSTNGAIQSDIQTTAAIDATTN